VDFITDEFIQNAIRKDFADATVITIAHRLNTVADYDKIMVLSFGRVIEYDSPQSLLENPNSEFSKMVHETGDANEAIIRSIALKNG
jgi:ABC-type multidrug transport system fused ATPase/permease subunit